MRRREREQLRAQVAGRCEFFAARVGDQAAVFAEDGVALGWLAADLAVDGCSLSVSCVPNMVERPSNAPLLDVILTKECGCGRSSGSMAGRGGACTGNRISKLA